MPSHPLQGMSTQSRQPRGVSTGGQFAGRHHDEAVGLVLIDPADEADLSSDDRTCDFDDTLDSITGALDSDNTAFTCSGTTIDGNPCLQRVGSDGAVCGLCNGTATDSRGNLLGRGGYPRDGRGSALVTCPDGSLYKSGAKKGTIKMLPYKSASGVVVQVSEEGLTVWKQKQLLKALAKDREFAARFHTAMDEAAESGDEEAEDEVLKAYLKEAHEIAETQLAAQKGTFAHWLTECQDNGESPLDGLAKGEALGIDKDMAARIAADWQKVNDDYGFESLAVEAKIVNDELRAAGTTDRVIALSKPLTFTHNGEDVTLPAGTRLISDLKTGKLRTDAKGNPNYWQKYSGQLAAYAGGQMYDTINGERLGWDPVGGRPSQDWGVIVHGDLEKMAKGQDDGFSVFMVDLRAGRDLALVSNELRNAEKIANKAISPAARPAA